jgi:alanine-glyoxylate transaminase/serine-glyoxylate transaminase/serine-pyruvate transaminase
MSNLAGRHFLQIPGPGNVPDRVLRAMDMPTMDHRGPEFAQLTRDVIGGMKQVFKTAADVVIFPASGTGVWDAALVNTLSPGTGLGKVQVPFNQGGVDAALDYLANNP